MEGPIKLMCSALLCLFIYIAGAYASDLSYVLKKGETQIVSIDPGTDIVVSDESIVDVHVLSNSQVVLRALGEGETDIWLSHRDKVRKLDISVSDTLSLSTSARINAIVEEENDLRKVDKQGVTVLSGQVSKRHYDELSKLSQSNERVLNLTEPFSKQAPMLTLRVNILETKRQYLEDIGIRWQGTTSGPTFSSALSGLFEWDAEINSQLMLMQRRGLAKLLANPTLSTQSGEKATFLAGGELPIPQVVAQGMQDVTFREYGIKLIIEPVVLAENKIKTRLHAELSNIDPAVSVSGVPGILSRRTESVFLSNDGDTMVLSGLLSTDESAQEDKVPGIGELPVIENAFNSQQSRSQATELVIMVTAERMDTAQKQARDRRDKLAQKNGWYRDDSILQLKETF
ncbi:MULTISPECIES: type II and III secretion system protein family protein [Idiomarina]|uniref:type II and III secretion system protein family protein n=1 Tax=Idiomarina TaxID=135575 RepID=UPI000C98BC2B|nr:MULTISPECIES: pilus assembly protein N-terminal domain-containing protein [Idiomarina]MAB22652.1 pilus assembly protein CpaC [Idiomarina sp.]|tara:strand:+ start:4925 stop:6127 length:1203 start_codon:yes stop_codon:yes gene_type:complete